MGEYGAFSLGMLYQSSGIAYAMKANTYFAKEIIQCLKKYSHGDWGDICGDDSDLNDKAVRNGERIFAKYNTMLGNIFIITEPDRTATTILFASEY